MSINFNKFATQAAGTGALLATYLNPGLARAANCDPTNGGIGSGAGCTQPNGVPDQLFGGAHPIFATIANTLIFLVGAIAVIMLIIGGLRYVLSSGNASSVEGAKNTILYAIIGIIVAILAFAAVQFVISRFGATA